VARRNTKSRQGVDRPGGQKEPIILGHCFFGARSVDRTAQACWWIVFRETKLDGLVRVARARIAECIGVSRLTVTRALRRLEKARLLTVIRAVAFGTGCQPTAFTARPKTTCRDAWPADLELIGQGKSGISAYHPAVPDLGIARSVAQRETVGVARTVNNDWVSATKHYWVSPMIYFL